MGQNVWVKNILSEIFLYHFRNKEKKQAKKILIQIANGVF